jgi:Domain of unknown function (DUF4440)
MKCPTLVRTLALIVPLVFLAAPKATFAQDPKATQDTVTRLLQEFLLHNDDPAQHERFWAADLVYTGSKGAVRSKAEIMKMIAGSKADPAQPKETYTAEDILVRPYGTTAALTFRLVRHTADGQVEYFRNSGTLLLRDGQWQVVTWQATKVSPVEEEKPSK